MSSGRRPNDMNLPETFRHKAQQISYATEILLNETKNWQAIRQFLVSRMKEFKLTPAQDELLQRYQFIYNQLVSGKFTDKEIIELVQKAYNCSMKTAYVDLNSTRELFASTININKVFELTLQLQINRNMLRKADEISDMKSYAALEKNRIAMIALLPDVEQPDGGMFEGHEIEAVFDPELIGADNIDMKKVIEEINQKRKVKIKSHLFTDIPHEPVDEKKTPL